jgi:Tol biopolymer transport system component
MSEMRRFILLFGALVGLAVVVLTSCGGRSQETKNPANSTPSIAFMKQDSDGFWQTWVANKDLSDQVKLTSESADSGWAVWKPGGAKLAFDSNRADPDPDDPNVINDIFTMNLDGSGIVKLTHSESLDSDAGWSPDGSQIAFASDRARSSGRTEIYVMDADGTNVRRVTTLPRKAKFDFAPRFSPDGTKLVFTRYITDTGRSALFTVRVDGGGLKQLTPWGNGAEDADWSPDGKKLVFEAYPDLGSRGEVFTIDADGQQLTNLTDNDRSGGGSSDPVWSLDGTKILFLSEHFFSGESGIGLATMNPDGTDRHFISPQPGGDAPARLGVGSLVRHKIRASRGAGVSISALLSCPYSPK